MFGTELNTTLIIQEPTRIFTAFVVLLGLKLNETLLRMCYYEYKYYKGAGDDYLKYGKRYVMRLRIMKKKYNEVKYTNELKKYFHTNYDNRKQTL